MRRMKVAVYSQSTRSDGLELCLCSDPRSWSRDDVHCWLRKMSLQFNLVDDVDTDRFPMNGKALCLMSCSMFVYRVPRAGYQLYADFQHRLLTAVLS